MKVALSVLFFFCLCSQTYAREITYDIFTSGNSSRNASCDCDPNATASVPFGNCFNVTGLNGTYINATYVNHTLDVTLYSDSGCTQVIVTFNVSFFDACVRYNGTAFKFRLSGVGERNSGLDDGRGRRDERGGRDGPLDFWGREPGRDGGDDRDGRH